MRSRCALTFDSRVGDENSNFWQWSAVPFWPIVWRLRVAGYSRGPFAVDGSVERSEPFVIDDKRLDLGLGQLGVVAVDAGIEFRARPP